MVNKKIIKVPIKNKANQKLVMIQFTDGKFTKKQIKKEVENLSKKFKNKNEKGEIMTSLYFGEDSPIKWGGGKWSSFGKSIHLFNIVDYDGEENFIEPKYFSAFNVFIRNY